MSLAFQRLFCHFSDCEPFQLWKSYQPTYNLPSRARLQSLRNVLLKELCLCIIGFALQLLTGFITFGRLKRTFSSFRSRGLASVVLANKLVDLGFLLIFSRLYLTNQMFRPVVSVLYNFWDDQTSLLFRCAAS